MEEDRKLTKKEKKELRKMEWAEKARAEEKNAKVKKYSIWAGVVLVVGLVILGLVWLVNTPATQTASLSAPAITTSDITNGEKNAKVTLIEYADFQCPACATYNPLVTQLLSDEKGKIYYAYRMFPLTNIHPNSHISAQAAYAAYKQNKFFEMSALLFNNQTDWANVTDPKSIYVGFAKKLNLDLAKFQKDMDSNEAKSYVNNSESKALSLGVNSTPTFFINGTQIQNPQDYNAFKKLIDDELNKK